MSVERLWRRLGAPGRPSSASGRARSRRASTAPGSASPDPPRSSALLDELACPQGLTAQRVELHPRARSAELLAERSGPLGGLRGRRGWPTLPRIGAGGAAAPDEADAPARYTTPELLATERELLEGAIERQAEGAGLVDERSSRRCSPRRPELSAEQAAMVRGLTEIRRRPPGGAGRAGSGKTYALEPARAAWEAEGHQVIGAALSARAAQELQAGSGIPSRTLARLLVDARDPERSPLHAMSVVVLDEAGMVGTRDLAELARHAEDAGAKLVLVGDDAQLPEIAAGGSFRALAQSLGALELADNRRQEHGWEREALLAIRQGRARRRGGGLLRATGASTWRRPRGGPSRRWWPTGWPPTAPATRP